MTSQATVSESGQTHQLRLGSYKMNAAQKTLALLLIVAIFAHNVECFVGFGEDGMLGKIKSGFQMAGKMLGLDRASGVAQLVSEAFGRTSRKGDHGDHKGTIFSGFLRVLGLDTRRIGAIAVNAIIFVAQLISTSLSKPAPYLEAGKSLDGTPLDWMLANPDVTKLLGHAKDENLPHQIIDYLKEGKDSENTGCLQLLICKSAPFVWGMQKAVNAKGADIKRGKRALSAYLPTLDEVADNADECELKHPHCRIHY